MKLIVFSPNKSISNETEWVTALFQNGLEIYHLKKPHFNYKRMSEYIQRIPKKYHNRIVIHSNHSLIKKFNLKGIHFPSKVRENKLKTWWTIFSLSKRKRKRMTVSTSFHNTTQLDVYENKFDYVFLSPIFDSITKKEYQSGFKEFGLSNSLSHSNYKVIALGGIDESKISAIKRMGFSGCALLGAIWTSVNPTKSFMDILDKCNSKEN